jgi:WD40 repeat protein
MGDELSELVGATISGDGTRLALADETGTVTVADTESGETVAEHAPVPVGAGADPLPVEDLAFSPDGTRVASSTGLAQTATAITPPAIQVWDAASGQTVAQYVPEGVQGQFEQFAQVLAWVDDEQIISGRTSGVVRVWDAATGLEGGDAYDGGEGEFVADVAVSADGERAVSVSRSGVARVWDVGSGDTLSTHTNRTAGQARLNADGSLVATAGSDGVIEVWDAESGQVLVRYELIDPPALLGFDPEEDTRFFAMTFTGRQLEFVEARQFDCRQCGELDDLIAYAEDRVTRELTDEERDRFLAT